MNTPSTITNVPEHSSTPKYTTVKYTTVKYTIGVVALIGIAVVAYLVVSRKPAASSKTTSTKKTIITTPTSSTSNSSTTNAPVPFVSFARVESQFMSTGPTTWNIATGGGFTAVVRFRFTGSTTPNFQTVFDSGNAAGVFDNNIQLTRMETGTRLHFTICTAAPATSNWLAGGTIVQDQWTTVVCRYTSSGNVLELFQDGVRVARGTSSTSLQNRTNSSTQLNRRIGGTEVYGDLDLAGLVLYARSLSDAEVQTVTNIVLGVGGSTALPGTPVYSLLASTLALTPGTNVSSWGDFAQTTAAKQPKLARDVATQT